MDKLAIHIVEDEALIAMDLEDIIVDLGHHVTGISNSYEEVMQILPEDQSDIFLVDIQLKGDKSGIDVGRELNNYGKIHIYISSLSARNVLKQARNTGAQGYILKPFSPDDIFVAVQMATGRIDREEATNAIFIREGKGRIKIFMKDILYAKAEGHYTHLYTRTRKYTLLRGLKKVQDELLTSRFFKRVHKSYLVNIQHIRKSSSCRTYQLTDGTQIPLSRTYKKEEF